LQREDFAFEFCGQFFFGGEKKYSTAKPRRFEMEDFFNDGLYGWKAGFF
jgi:hypothetical protein